MEIIDTGRMKYQESYDLQLKCRENIINNKEIDGYIVVTECEPTITKGMRGNVEDIYLPLHSLQEKGIEVVDIRRGGLVTFHGPGQIVVYPILNLEKYKKSIRWYVDLLERVVIKTLLSLNIDAYKKEGIVGIFTDKGKICAIGIEIKKWVTLHGIAINNDINLSYFDMINPCGLKEQGVSSIKNEGKNISNENLKGLILGNLLEELNTVN